MKKPLTVGDLREAISGVDDAMPLALVTSEVNYDAAFTHIHRSKAIDIGVRELRLPQHGYWFDHVKDALGPPGEPVVVFCIGECSIDATSHRDDE